MMFPKMTSERTSGFTEMSTNEVAKMPPHVVEFEKIGTTLVQESHGIMAGAVGTVENSRAIGLYMALRSPAGDLNFGLCHTMGVEHARGIAKALLELCDEMEAAAQAGASAALDKARGRA